MTLITSIPSVQNVDSNLTTKVKVPWVLNQINHVKKNNLNVFSCFSGGGGSTMGYKLAGYNVIGCVEIDKKMFQVYKNNHRPLFGYNEGIQSFCKRNDLPIELYNLDILDGSPPCSSFSMAGSREKKWGKASKFKEGQANQVLDDLFFHFIDLANKLQPKVVIAENVKGLITGNAKGYVKQIFTAFNKCGYQTQLFLLNSSRMGVAQRRERVFFIARKKSLNWSDIKLKFTEPEIPIERVLAIPALSSTVSHQGKKFHPCLLPFFPHVLPGSKFSSVHPKGNFFNYVKVSPKNPLPTIKGGASLTHWIKPVFLSDFAVLRGQSFPDDFNFGGTKVLYICGMSVPPLMTQRIASSIYNQWFK